MKGEGRIFQRGAVFWIAYYVRGKEFREPGGKTEKEAAKRLKARLGEKHGDRFIGPEQERVTVDELLKSFVLYLEMKGAKSLYSRSIQRRKTVRAFFGDLRAVDVATKRIEAFMSLNSRPSPARRRGRLPPPLIAIWQRSGEHSTWPESRGDLSGSLLPDAPARTTRGRGSSRRTSSSPSLLRSRWHSPKSLGSPTSRVGGKARSSRWRWENVDRSAGEVRIVTSKNGYGRVLPLTGALKDLIERRWTAREQQDPREE